MARAAKNGNGNGRKFNTQQSLDGYIKSACDIMRRSNCAGALQYVPELTWILFLRILDEQEQQEAEHAEAVGASFTYSLQPPYRWHDWAAPYSEDLLTLRDGLTQGWKRKELQDGKINGFIDFVNGDLLPHLKKLREQPNAKPRQKVISEILSGTERTRIDTERNLLDILDKVHEISSQVIDDTHIYTLSQVYEGLLLKMGEKGNDGGQFFTPRVVVRAMVQAINPTIGETVYDAGCGTGGFLAQAYEHMAGKNNANITSAEDLEILKQKTFYGREKDNAIYPIALANLILHGIDAPQIWHGNTLTGGETYGGLFTTAPALYDVALMNPPFGGKEGKEAQTNFPYKTSSTQVLFLQHVLNSLKPKGRCGIVLDEGILFRTNETAFVQTKKKLLDDADVWCIVSLPGGVFTTAGAGVKTNLVFFTKGKSTQQIWYYDLSDLKVAKKSPLTLEHFEDFFQRLPAREESDRSWTVTIEEIEAKNYDLKAVNPNAKSTEDLRTPDELLDVIETKGKEVTQALAILRGSK
ncbi:MAG: type I restriction-modification system subunit M [Scytolyngbya sp. HA4215-MV1]|jgi:type I restriction enzyme M protein|nr:type I restriction-modification system subunit M [Scytolyngbya sp. HA4215-MV1]